MTQHEGDGNPQGSGSKGAVRCLDSISYCATPDWLGKSNSLPFQLTLGPIRLRGGNFVFRTDLRIDLAEKAALGALYSLAEEGSAREVLEER